MKLVILKEEVKEEIKKALIDFLQDKDVLKYSHRDFELFDHGEDFVLRFKDDEKEEKPDMEKYVDGRIWGNEL